MLQHNMTEFSTWKTNWDELPYSPFHESVTYPPNGLLWAYDSPRGFRAVYKPDCQDFKILSRNVLENCDPDAALEQWGPMDEPLPRILHPWPLLELRAGANAPPDVSIGVLDSEYLLDLQEMQQRLTIKLPPLNATKKEKIFMFPIVRTPKLQELIPREFFPEVLVVNDPGQLTATQNVSQYIRLFPRLERERYPGILLDPHTRAFPSVSLSLLPTDLRKAYVDFTSASILGVGGHATVYRPNIVLPDPLRTKTLSGEVAVAAKIAFDDPESRDQLQHEGKIYDSFPRHLMEDWSGFNYIEEATYDGLDGSVQVNSVVPKFYGYYIPVQNQKQDDAKVPPRSPILLMEDCGRHIHPIHLRRYPRTEAYSLPHRLHAAGYVHNSLRTHKILVQPGPLTHPPHMRTMSRPRFRIIDFGCAQSIGDKTDDSWDALVKCEVYRAKVTVYGSHIKPSRKKRAWGTLSRSDLNIIPSA